MKFIQPMKFSGTYPKSWAGYVFLQWSWHARNWHEGVDYNFGSGSNDLGLPILATADGVAEWFGYHNGWGYHAFIRHDHPEHGTIYSHYAHLMADVDQFIKIGQQVKCGQQVGRCGKSGWVNMSPHLHFEIRKPIGQGYGFYPTLIKGWTQTKTKQYYFDPYLFIEKNKV